MHQWAGPISHLVTLLTLLSQAAGYYLADCYGDLSMRPGEAMGEMLGMPMPDYRM